MSEIPSDSNRNPNNPTASIPTGWEDMTVAYSSIFNSNAPQEPQTPLAQARGRESVNSEGVPTNPRLEAEPGSIKQRATGENSNKSNLSIENTRNYPVPQDSAEQLGTIPQSWLTAKLDIQRAKDATESAIILYEREIEVIKEKIRSLEEQKENLAREAEDRPSFDALVKLKNKNIEMLEEQKKMLEEDLKSIVSMCDSFVAKAEKNTKNQNSASEMSPTAKDPTTANQ